MPERLRSMIVTVKVETSHRLPEQTFVLHEDESVDNLMLRVQQWVEEQMEDING